MDNSNNCQNKPSYLIKSYGGQSEVGTEKRPMGEAEQVLVKLAGINSLG